MFDLINVVRKLDNHKRIQSKNNNTYSLRIENHFLTSIIYRLIVRHIPLNAAEHRMQRYREKQLEPVGEDDEEEVEESSEEENVEVAAEAKTEDSEKKPDDAAEATKRPSRSRSRSKSRSKSHSKSQSRSRSRSRSNQGEDNRSKSKSPGGKFSSLNCLTTEEMSLR